MKFLGRILAGIILVLFFMFCGAYVYKHVARNKESMAYNSELIQDQIKNVSKLVVTEAHFSQVMTYKDSKKYMLNLLAFKKQAVVIINADATVSYDLSKLEYLVDESRKTVRITKIPEQEIKIYPEIKLYDVEQSTFNPFVGDDYNKINKKVQEDLRRKIEKSTLKANAENRLISELSKILIVTQSLGWTLEYKDAVIASEEDLTTDLLL